MRTILCAAAVSIATMEVQGAINLDNMLPAEMDSFVATLTASIIELTPSLKEDDIESIVLQAVAGAGVNPGRERRAAVPAEVVITFSATVNVALATSAVDNMNAAILAGTFTIANVTVGGQAQTFVFGAAVASTAQADSTDDTTDPAALPATSETRLDLNVSALNETEKEAIKASIMAQNLENAGGAFVADDIDEIQLVPVVEERSVVETTTIIDNSCAEIGDAGTASFAVTSADTAAAGGTAVAECNDCAGDCITTRQRRRLGVESSQVTVTYSFSKGTDGITILVLIRAQAAIPVTFMLANGTKKTSSAAVAGTKVRTVVSEYIKVVLTYAPGSVSDEELAQVAATINALPALDKAIAVGGTKVQPEAEIVAQTNGCGKLNCGAKCKNTCAKGVICPLVMSYGYCQVDGTCGVAAQPKCPEEPKACCKALNALCLAQCASMSQFEYCELNPSTTGCKSACPSVSDICAGKDTCKEKCPCPGCLPQCALIRCKEGYTCIPGRGCVAHTGCEKKQRGDTCSQCHPDDTDCVETEILKTCQDDMSTLGHELTCMVGKQQVVPANECSKLNCGTECTSCAQ